MTGFGAASIEDGLRIVSVEVRSVNHRYLDVRTHLPIELARLAGPIEARAKKRLSRGRIEISVSLEFAKGWEEVVSVDVEKAKAYHEAYRRLSDELSVPFEVRLETIAAMPGVLAAPDLARDVGIDHVAVPLDRALDAAIEMREAEGRALGVELAAHLATVVRVVEQIRALAPEMALERRSRLERRLADVAGSAPIEPARLAQELALLADRSDVTEEVERLMSHAAQLESLFRTEEPAGRKLDFLIQEMNREVNTIGSKSANEAVTYAVVELKAELERMREQAQNVE
jgi:uncharacterized protein (TIGR00255 family)